MTESHMVEALELQLGDRLRAYTDVATSPRIDALWIARTAMLRSASLPRRPLPLRWITSVGLVALVAIAVVALTAQLQPPEPVGGPIPDALRHAWQRPYMVAPGRDLYGSGFLKVTGGQLEYGRQPGAGASSSAVTAKGADALRMTATAATLGCAVGAVGDYRWLVEGSGTVLTLTAIGSDACAAREKALAGPWVRSDLPPQPIQGGDPTLPPGTHVTTGFEPFGAPTPFGQLSYTVPGGWKNLEDSSDTFVLHRPHDVLQGGVSSETFIAVLTRPAMAADASPGTPCGPLGDAPDAETLVGALVAAIVSRPGVASGPPEAVTIGGYSGTVLDLQLAPSWTGSCSSPQGPIVGLPILLEAGSGGGGGPVVGLSPDHPLRLILLDLKGGRTLAIAIFDVAPLPPASFAADVAEAMPIIESFEFHAPTP